ncbi:hypothetical protein [Thermocrinis sp.]|jgi:hypothetical protein|uniref:hypothetical protein n=1 Tax=Thermocrinis sp. TaxID=2024383 RepID=UPI003BFF5353
MKVQILVNGKEVKLKDFPKRALYNVVLGFLKSLKLEEEPKNIVIEIEVGEREHIVD